jgi:hypothetical protein
MGGFSGHGTKFSLSLREMDELSLRLSASLGVEVKNRELLLKQKYISQNCFLVLCRFAKYPVCGLFAG